MFENSSPTEDNGDATQSTVPTSKLEHTTSSQQSESIFRRKSVREILNEEEDVKEDEPFLPEVTEEIKEAGELPPPRSSFYNQILLILPFSVLGVYCRIILQGATPPGLVNYLSSQVVGSFVIGYVFHNKDLLHPDIFVAISTGFCGSVTTFSTWQLDVVEAIVGVPGSQTYAGGKAYVWFQDQIVGFAVPYVALIYGKILSKYSQAWLRKNIAKVFPRTDDSTKMDNLILSFSILSFILGLTGVIIGASLVPDITTFSLIFAAPGAWLRFLLSRHLNPLSMKFFWGTFIANILASVISGIMFGITTLYVFPTLSCQAIWAVEIGFSGALSTISTFVNEIHILTKRKYAIIYGFTSVLIAQALLIVIAGSFVWTQEKPFNDPLICYYQMENLL